MNQHGMTTSTSIRLALAACLALPAACSRHEPPAPPKRVAATPAPPAPGSAEPRALDNKREPEIMRAIFGNRYDATARSAIPVDDDSEANGMLMTFVAAATLPDGRIGVVVNGAPADENGNDVSDHATAGTLHVYVLQRAGQTWTVAERHENVAEMGSDGHMTKARWVALGPGKTGFIVSSGGMWQGYSISDADVFELGNDMRSLGSFHEAGSNEGACGPETDECWDIDSRIRFDAAAQHGGYSDILVDFTGKQAKLVDGKNAGHVETPVRQTARYRFDGKAYALVAGSNPVPGI
jgi:hypothetical protein